MIDKLQINNSFRQMPHRRQQKLKPVPLSFKSNTGMPLKKADVNKVKTGWVLDVGGAKGVFQTGAMEALIDTGFIPDIIKGASVGSINTGFLLGGGQHIEGLKSIWRNMSLSKVLDLSLSKCRSLLNNTPLKNAVNNIVDKDLFFENIEKQGTEVIIHSTEISKIGLKRKKALFATEKACQRLKELYKDNDDVSVYKLTKDNLAKAILGSSALPFIFPSVTIDDKIYSDGFIFDNHPSEDGKIALGSILKKGQKGVSFVVLCHPPRNGDLEIDAAKLKDMGISEKDLKTVVIAPDMPLEVRLLSFNKAGADAHNYIDYGYISAIIALKNEGFISEEKYNSLVEKRKREKDTRENFELVA
jgi:NTE family protein